MIVSEAAAVRRHDLVWIDVDRLSPQTLGTVPAIPAAVDAWFRHGRPAVVCRQHQAAPDRLRLGIPLPPREGGARVAFVTARAAMRTVQAPPALTQVIPSAPVHWREPLQRLALAADALGISLSVYGSLLWQHVTGESYVTSRSDIDLLLRVCGSAQLLPAFKLLRDWEQESGLRADGEVQLADGAGVAWRELARAPATVLVKSLHDVQLRPGREILQRLTTAPT